MTKLLRLVLPICSAFVLSACGQKTGSRSYDVARYDLDASYDWSRNRLVGNVRITLSPNQDEIEDLDLDSGVIVKDVRIDGFGSVDFEVQPDKHLWVSLDDVDAKKGAPIVVEIDYEAVPSDNLRPITKRVGDPITTRSVYTDSEPQGARQWMPSKDEPHDRAIFSVGLRMSSQEMAIANGKLVEDKPALANRYMRYETAYPLPTYLMAFAISEFDVVSGKHGDLPIEVWHRKGLPGDHATMITELSRMMGEMENLVGPYPFERYALVLLPGHMSSGMENAGISFQRETSSTAPGLAGDLSLAAHELAHQWFGDLVTVKTWDDVWIKEGLATLLTEELVRSHLDRNGSGTLNGDEFGLVDGEAIRDPDKPPKLKYDSGPYSRSAWFFTQIREKIGDEAFFAALKGLLETHRMGVIDMNDIVHTFGPSFDPGGEDKLRRALSAKAIPYIDGADLSDEATLIDPDGALLTSFDVEWISVDGSRRSATLEVDKPLSLASNPGEVRIMDPADVHPNLGESALFMDSPDQFAQFLELPGIHQYNILDESDGAIMPIDLSNVSTFLGAMHSDAAEALALERVCQAGHAATVDATIDPQWSDLINSSFATKPTPFGASTISWYLACNGFIDPATSWPDEWQKMQDGLPNADISEERLVFLSRFNVYEQSTWATMLGNAGSLRARQLAAGRMTTATDNHAFFVEQAKSIEAAEILRSNLLNRLGNTSRKWKEEWKATGDSAALDAFNDGLGALTAVLKKDVTRPAHAYAICTARNLMSEWDTSAETPRRVLEQSRWQTFVSGLQGAPLSEMADLIRQDPSVCD